MLTTYVLSYLISGTKGGMMRAKILLLLKKKPQNMNKIAEILKIDYKTAQHHLRILVENNVVASVGKYGALYHLTPDMDEQWNTFKEML